MAEIGGSWFFFEIPNISFNVQNLAYNIVNFAPLCKHSKTRKMKINFS
jgi:hypothetical protein